MALATQPAPSQLNFPSPALLGIYPTAPYFRGSSEASFLQSTVPPCFGAASIQARHTVGLLGVSQTPSSIQRRLLVSPVQGQRGRRYDLHAGLRRCLALFQSHQKSGHLVGTSPLHWVSNEAKRLAFSRGVSRDAKRREEVNLVRLTPKQGPP